MAQVIQRTWRSGPRRVKRSAWGYTVQIQGKQERKFDAAWSKDDAQNALAARLLDRDTPAPPPVAPVVTFKAMTERYLAEKQASGKKTIQNDHEAITKFLAFFGEETPLDAVTAPRIAEYRLKRLETPLARTKRRRTTSAVNRELSILVGLLRMAADEECGYLPKAPTVRRLKEPQGPLRYLELARIEGPDGTIRWESAEASRLLAACRDGAHSTSTCRSPYLYDIVVVGLHTGMRKGEILGLEWPRIDFSRGVIQLEQTKNGTRREVPHGPGCIYRPDRRATTPRWPVRGPRVPRHQCPDSLPERL
jgi:integrase